VPLLLGKAQKRSQNIKKMTVLSKLSIFANQNRSLKFTYFWSWFFFKRNPLVYKDFQMCFWTISDTLRPQYLRKTTVFYFFKKYFLVLRRYCGLLIKVLVVLNTFWTFLNFDGPFFDSAKVLWSLDSPNVLFLNGFRHLWDHTTPAESLFWKSILWFCEGTVDFRSNHSNLGHTLN
jgi:hypothetical protein